MRSVLIFFASLVAIGCASPGGIGVGYTHDNIVRIVYTNSPAEKIGILVDDLLLNPRQLRGSIGSICHVKWQRGDKKFEADVKRVDVSKFNRF